MRQAMTGNEAVAYAMKQINPEVVAAYPITPQTGIMQKFADYVANGQVDTEFLTMDSEHSAMSATIGASAAGVRAMTATSSNGLAYMWEIVYIAASYRLPIVMPVVNRALSGPINIHCDHSDTMGCRDSGWIQIFSENSQEAYDNAVQALRIAEHPDVMLPVMITLDGFIISHALETLSTYEDDKVKKFIGNYIPKHPLINPSQPVTYGPLDFFDYYFEHKRQQAEGMVNAKKVIQEVGRAFEKEFNRSYGLFEEYRMADAELALIVLGSTAGTAKAVVDMVREKGYKIGLIKIRCFRPFPEEELAEALKRIKVLAVMDRSLGFNGVGGPLFNDVRAALFGRNAEIKVVNYVYGLGGREITPNDIWNICNNIRDINLTGKVQSSVNYVGVRE
ncbi:MAG: transketolase C-terminal domain-containing protein [bacterium]